MNLCFFIGKIISEVEFDFIINSKNVSVAIFELELDNGSIIRIKGYNSIADYCYQRLQKGDVVAVCGVLDSKGEIEMREIFSL